MTRLRTALTELLRVRVPLLNAPMTPQAGGALARAVAEAGAFGMLGFDEDEAAESIAAQATIVRAAGLPFGIGLAAWALDRRPQLLELAIEMQPRLVSISFGDPGPYVERLHAAGILVASQVQSRAWARVALDAGVDVLVAQGTEAGGHTGAVGTPFLLAAESRTTPEAQAQIVASDETQTILTHVYDRAQGKDWPAEFRGRALRNPFVERWHEREDELMRTPVALEEFAQAKRDRDYGRAHIYAGQSVGALGAVTPAGEIVHRLEDETIVRLAASAALLVERD